MASKFGKLLESSLKEKGVTQIQLLKRLWHDYEFETKDRKGALKLKYGESDVSKWKSGRTKPPQEVVWALEDILSTPKGSLLEAVGYENAAEFRKLEEGKKMEAKELTDALDLGWLTGRFLSCLKTPDPCRIFSIGTELNESLWVEGERLFPKLKRFLNSKFWRKFNDWKKARVQCFKECVSFLDAVHQKAEEETRMQTTECWEEKGLNDAFWQRIYTHVLLKTKPQPLNVLDRGHLKNLDTTEFVVIDNDLVVKGENTVLAKGEPFQLDRVSKAYWNLVTEFTSASEPKQIWELWQELGITEKLLYKQLEAVSRELIPNWFRCRELEI